MLGKRRCILNNALSLSKALGYVHELVDPRTLQISSQTKPQVNNVDPTYQNWKCASCKGVRQKKIPSKTASR